MNIAMLIRSDSLDRRTWSGITYHVGQALERHCGPTTYVSLAPYSPRVQFQHGSALERLAIVGRALRHRAVGAWARWRGKDYIPAVSVAEWYGQTARRQLDEHAADVIVVAEGMAGAEVIACLQTNLPIVYIHDSTFALLRDYYDDCVSLLPSSARELNTVEALAIEKATLLVYPTAWAARSAISDYGADPVKVRVIPFGANLEPVPDRAAIEARASTGECRLLFVGVEWHRKGGDIAVDALRRLEQMGVPAQLVICGCTPPSGYAHPRITVVPYLDQTDAQQRAQLHQLYAAADFLLLPTRTECFGIVFCEGNAFGLPAITSRTGGVSDVIQDGINGVTLPSDASGDDYATAIAALYANRERYARMVVSSRQAFEDRLNWDTWGSTLRLALARFDSRTTR